MSEGVWSAWPERWNEVLSACERMGGPAEPLVVEPPASRDAITGVEHDLYLSHDGGESHGLVLGCDFIDFMDRWSSLGSPGPEDWAWLPFHSAAENALDPTCANATAWRRWLGVSW